jgi:hypothetical protein
MRVPNGRVLDQPVRYDSEEGGSDHRRRRALYMVFTAVVTLIVGAAVVEAVTAIPVYGVDSRTVRTSAGDVRLEVTYPHLTRGGLQSTLRVRITRDAGFDGPVTIRLTSAYLDRFTTDDVSPEPTSETTAGESLAMTFDQPDGDTLDVDVDLVAHPRGDFGHAAGTAAVVDDQGDTVAAVRFVSDVRP